MERVHIVQLVPGVRDSVVINEATIDESSVEDTVLLIPEERHIRFFTHRHLRLTSNIDDHYLHREIVVPCYNSLHVCCWFCKTF